MKKSIFHLSLQVIVKLNLQFNIHRITMNFSGTLLCNHCCVCMCCVSFFFSWTNDGQYLALGLFNGFISIRNKV